MALRRNPYSLDDEARYFQAQIINAMAGYPSGITTSNSPEQLRLVSFLERVINSTTQSPVVSPHKTYSPSGMDPTTFPEKPKAVTPPRHVSNAISSKTKINHLERKARLGDQQAILDYLEILDFQGEIEIENLWVVPYVATPYDDIGPDAWIFTPPFPYTLGDNLTTVEKFNNTHHLIQPGESVKGAFVVDIGSLELSDIVDYNIGTYLRLDVDPTNIGITVKYFILQAEAILILDQQGWRFPLAHEIGQIPSNKRQSKKYWQLQHRAAHPGKMIRGSGPIQTRWPQRKLKQLPIAQFPGISAGIPYVVITHIPTGRAFALNGGYGLIDGDVDEETILHAMRYNRQADSWLPTMRSQRPAWANEFLSRGGSSRDFMAYWVAE